MLLPQVIRWWHIAQQCFSNEYGSLQRGFLTSVFMPVVGLERVFHLDHVEDPGFAVLSGGTRSCPSRYLVGAWRRHLAWNEVDRFCHRTSPWELLHDLDALISFDEHSIPRWTKKFSIRKGYVTTRNKYMRCEKLYYGYEPHLRRFVTVKATPGNIELRDVSGLLTRRVLRFGQPSRLHALFDAGAGKSDADVRALLQIAEDTPNLDVTLRACRYPHRLKLWKELPPELFTTYEEAGTCVGAPPKIVRLAETTTTLKGETETDGVRTIVCREVMRGPKKDRWHPLYTSHASDALEPRQVLEGFRQRQHHEQGYRVQVHDEHLNAAICGYDKQSLDPKRPRFCRGPLQMIGWLAALVYNTCADFADGLGSDWQNAFIRTLRNEFFNQPGRLYCTPAALIVYLDCEYDEQHPLIPYIDRMNAEQHRIPWLNNRLLVFSARHTATSRAGP